MDIQNFEMGILSYAEKYVVPQLPSSLDRWILYLGLSAGGAALEKTMGTLLPALQQIGLSDNAGGINLDAMETFGMLAFKKQPKVTIWKLTFTEGDFQQFMKHLRTGSEAPENTVC